MKPSLSGDSSVNIVLYTSAGTRRGMRRMRRCRSPRRTWPLDLLTAPNKCVNGRSTQYAVDEKILILMRIAMRIVIGQDWPDCDQLT